MDNKPTHNLRVIEYVNGMVEFRKYSVPINSRNIGFEPFDKTIPRFYSQMELDLGQYGEYEDIVFEKEIEELTEEEIKARAERSVKSSLNRTIQKIYSISRQCNWEYFVTLTFDDEKVDRYDYDLCVNRLSRWLEYQRQTYAEDLQYLFVPELHKDNAIHFHGLIARVGIMDISYKGHFIDRKKLPNGRWVMLKKPMEILEVGGWNYGFSNATKVQDVQKVSSYITKYITKELCIRGKGKKRYFSSKNIPPSKETYILSDNANDDLQILVDSFGFDIAYKKKVEGEYQTVEYIFLNTNKESEEKENEKR